MPHSPNDADYRRSPAVLTINSHLTARTHHFHQHFGLPAPLNPAFLPPDLAQFRTQFLREEVEEYATAVENGDLPGAFDALIDLVYVALGTSYLHGFPFDVGFAVVHEANMKKERRPSPRSSTYDVVKPEGWVHPDIAAVLAKYARTEDSE